jgi:hypothetical protein
MQSVALVTLLDLQTDIKTIVLKTNKPFVWFREVQECCHSSGMFTSIPIYIHHFFLNVSTFAFLKLTHSVSSNILHLPVILEISDIGNILFFNSVAKL